VTLADRVAGEVVLVVSPRLAEPTTGERMAELAATGAAAAASLAQAVVGMVLDVVVPPVANAIATRIDLRPIIERALDEMDLTEIVLSRVDLDAVVQEVDVDAIIDRLPILEIAQYVIHELDVPGLIQQSTGGVARSAMDWMRIGSLRGDQFTASIVDGVLRWRGARRVEVDPA
jgi:hypothetical protein